MSITTLSVQLHIYATNCMAKCVHGLQGFTCFVFCVMNKYDSKSLNACFYPRRRQLRLVCVRACIVASSMMKIPKCLTLFYMCARPCLVGLAVEINKTVKLSWT